MRIVSELKSCKGGTLSVTDERDIISDGIFYILRDKTLSAGGQAVKINSKDVLYIGKIKYSSFPRLWSSLVCFGIAGVLYKVLPPVKAVTAASKIAANDAFRSSKIVSFIASVGDERVYDTARSFGKTAAFIRDASAAFYDLMYYACIILLILAAIQLVRYALSCKRLVEINTAYGSFCIDKFGISDNELNRFIRCFNDMPKSYAAETAEGNKAVCPSCSAENASDSKFCKNCGTKLI